MKKLQVILNLGGSTIALIAAGAFTAGSAIAQTDSTDSTAIEQVVVTGTNIRGTAPVGENVMTVSTADIQAQGGNDLDEVLKAVPALASMGQNAQGEHNSTYFTPNIHEIGGSSSSSTLVLIDGMRPPLGGTQHSQPDPSIIPTNAVQRIDVLADGASSIYGSDAVAGVVNYILRRDYEGLEIGVEGGGGRDYNRWNGSLLWGTKWAGGSAMLAYQHSYDSDIPLGTRVTNENNIARGGTNYDSFNCSPATIQPAGSSTIILSPTSTTAVSSATANSPCFYPTGDYVPKQSRDDVLTRVSQSFGKDLTVSATVDYGVRRDASFSNGGTVTGTAFSAGPQANPFYINPPGVTATSQTVRYSLTGIIPRSETFEGANDLWAHVDAEYSINDNWQLSLNVVAGQDTSNSGTYNAVCGACVLEALNGTTQTTGSTTSPAIPNTNIAPTMLPLTTANALDVWDTDATNKTSAATIARMTSNQTYLTSLDSIEEYRAGLNGTLFQLPAGDLKVALGGELYNNSLIETQQKTDGIGPTSYGSSYAEYHFSRMVESAYAEAIIPIISPDMAIPLAEKVSINISGRYDHYNILGKTANPKYSFDWEVTDGLKLRGSYSTSFVAPQLDSIGDPNQNYLASYSSAGATSGAITFPTANYPGTAGVLPGCPTGAVTCQIGTATVQGISRLSGIGPNAKPEEGNGYSVGVDFAPTFIPGLVTQATLFNANFKGAVQTIPTTAYVNVPSISKYVTICPTGCSAAFVASALSQYSSYSSALPATVYYFLNNDQKNIENFSVQGLDMSATYDFDTGIGHFKLGEAATYLLKYDIGFGFPVSGPYFSLLNTDGQTGQFPEIQLQSRSDLGWSNDNIAVDVFMNVTGGYTNWSAPANPITLNPATNQPAGGGDPVASNITFDAHIAYTLPEGFMGGDQVYINGLNIFDKKPPFYNSATGNDDFVTSLIGRIVTLGLRAKF